MVSHTYALIQTLFFFLRCCECCDMHSGLQSSGTKKLANQTDYIQNMFSIRKKIAEISPETQQFCVIWAMGRMVFCTDCSLLNVSLECSPTLIMIVGDTSRLFDITSTCATSTNMLVFGQQICQNILSSRFLLESRKTTQSTLR